MPHIWQLELAYLFAIYILCFVELFDDAFVEFGLLSIIFQVPISLNFITISVCIFINADLSIVLANFSYSILNSNYKFIFELLELFLLFIT